MRYIKTYEAWKPLIEIKTKNGEVLRYRDDWKVPNHPEREEVSRDLMDIFRDLKDEGYSVRDGGYLALSDYPYVWISGRTRERKGKSVDWDIVDEYVSRSQDYLGSRGFVTLVNKMNDWQMYLYFDKNPIKEAFKLKVPGDIKSELGECFLSLGDLIPEDTRTNPGIKVSGIAKKEYNSLEGFGRPGDYVRVMVIPKMKDISNYIESDRKYKDQSFPRLSYTPAEMNVEEFYDELIDCMNLAESTGFKINCAFVAWSNGGELQVGPGELTKKFKYDGVDPENTTDNKFRGAYDIEKLEWFLKSNVKDRLRWIKIFYS